MNTAVEFLLNKASAAQIADHLIRCNADFIPPLSGRVDIEDYAQKIGSYAMRFEAWENGTLVGLVAAYCNDNVGRIGHITSVSVVKAWTGKGIAMKLVSQCVQYIKTAGMRQISLEVASDNISAIKLYEKSGFAADNMTDASVTMNLYLQSAGKHE